MMISKNELERINKLSFRQLKNELSKCDNPIKERIIRNLMVVRYKEYLDKKKMISSHYKPQQTQLTQQNENSFNENPFNEDDFYVAPKIKSLNELDDYKEQQLKQLQRKNNELTTNRKIKEQSRDKVNNSIVERLNGDIDINEMRSYKKRPSVVSPYTNFPGDNYASFKSNENVSNKDFRNKKIK